MAKNTQPIAKRCKALGISPAVMGYNKKVTTRNSQQQNRRKKSEYATQLQEKHLGYAATRREARQLVNHGHFTVNGKKVNIPSYQVKPGMVIELREASRKIDRFKENVEANSSVVIPKWLEFDAANLVGKVVAAPTREDIEFPVEEHLIIELYSK